MTVPRLFLVTPAEGLSDSHIIGCAQAACAVADCASILVGETIAPAAVPKLQALGLAVIIRDCEPRLVHHLKADGIHISRAQPVKALRATLKNESIGVFAATSRHIAMEASEAGADYVAFAQASQKHGEPLLQWWQDIFEIPAVAFDPVSVADLATLLPQKPDFIRPMNEMWQSPEQATAEITALAKVMR
jgi:thiamine-phosphate pyrophosphorylase